MMRGSLDLNKNCSEYIQGKVDTDNVEIRYSLRPMTSLWRHIFLTKVGVSSSTQSAVSLGHHFCEYRVLLVHRRDRIVYYVLEFKTIQH